MKRLFVLFFLFFSFLFGAQHFLLDPSKARKATGGELNGEIVDIGFSEPSNAIKRLTKIWSYTDVDLRKHDLRDVLKGRELSEEWNCIIDDYGVENCSQDQYSCDAHELYKRGESEKHTVTKIVEAKKAGCMAAAESAANAAPGQGFQIRVELTKQAKIDWVAFSEDTELSIYKDENYYTGWGGKSWEGRCGYPVIRGTFMGYSDNGCTGGSTVDYFGSSVYANKSFSLNVREGGSASSDKIGYMVKIEAADGSGECPAKAYKLTGYIDWFGRYVGTTTPIPLQPVYECPEGYEKIDDNKCKLEYSYYDYFCKDDNATAVDGTVTYDDENKDGQWKGPLIDHGGDCQGDNLNANNECQSPTPPEKNCIFTYFTCPVDSGKECTKRIDPDNPGTILDGRDLDYRYEQGSSEKISKRVDVDVSCEEGMTWNANTKKCEIAPLTRCAHPGMKKVRKVVKNENEACFEDLETGETVCTLYTIPEQEDMRGEVGGDQEICLRNSACSADEIFDETLKTCVKKPSISCKDGEVFDVRIQKCVSKAYCKYGDIWTDGKCISIVDECPSSIYAEDGTCQLVDESRVNAHLYGDILLEPTVGTLPLQKGFRLHYNEMISGGVISKEKLVRRGYNYYAGKHIFMLVAVYGNSKLKFKNKVNEAYVIVSNGGSLNGTDNRSISSSDGEWVEAYYHFIDPPEDMEFECEGICLIAKANNKLFIPTLLQPTKDTCPPTIDNVVWRVDPDLDKCIADMKTLPVDDKGNCPEDYVYSAVIQKCYLPVEKLYPGKGYQDNTSGKRYLAEDFHCLNGGIKDASSPHLKCTYPDAKSCIVEDATPDPDNFYCYGADPKCDADHNLTKTGPDTSGYMGEVTIKAEGGFSFSVTSKDSDYYNGFCLGLHRLKLSDGNWYKAEDLNLHVISEIGEIDDKTIYDGKCLKEFKITIPSDLSLVGISDQRLIDKDGNTAVNYSEIFIVNGDTYTRFSIGKIATDIALDRFESLCSRDFECKDGEHKDVVDGLPSCWDQDIEEYCSENKEFDSEHSVCVNDGFCEDGYTLDQESGSCKRDYFYYLYSCPTGYEISELGYDCQGSCGADGCSCNSETPPAENCKSKDPITPAEKTVETYPLLEHNATGSVLEKQYGTFKDYSCGRNCQFNIDKIYGKDNKICFHRPNGDESCIKVDGCSFNGTLEDLYYPDEEGTKKLRNLLLIDQHTLTLEDYNLPYEFQDDDTIQCQSPGTVYNKDIRYCEGSANFNNWSRALPGNANWKVLDGGARLYQGINGDPTAYLSNHFYEGNVIFEGKMRVDERGDDDWVGFIFGFKNDSSYYLLDIVRSGGNNSSSSYYVTLGKITGPAGINWDHKNTSSFHVLTGSNAFGWKPGEEVQIKIAYVDNTIRVWVNGKQIIDYIDPTVEKLQDGKIGFFNFSIAKVTYWDFHISSSPVCSSKYEWNEEARSCIRKPEKDLSNSFIKSSCRMNGHIGWHSRDEGIVSIISDGSRLKFWDPYKDEYLGFLEFVPDVPDEAIEKGFMPEFTTAYNLLADKFTAIDSIDGTTYYVYYEPTDEEKCKLLGAKHSLEVFSPTIEGKRLKTMTGARGVREESLPVCSRGTFMNEVNTCVADINKPTVCPNGKYEKSTNLEYLVEDGIKVSDSTMTQYMSAFADISYTFEFEYKGAKNSKLTIFIDGGKLVESTFPHNGSVTIPLPRGSHRINILMEDGVTDFGLKVTDGTNRITGSGDWCRNDEPVECPETGFVNFNNVCYSQDVLYCLVGEMDKERGRCVLTPKCILKEKGNRAFRDQKQAVKITYTLDGGYDYFCSPWTCENHKCQTASCPEDYEGTKVSLDEEDFSAYEAGELCMDQVCDAKKPYYEVCGAEPRCPTELNTVIEKDGECLEMYCKDADAVLDWRNERCKVYECPPNTKEDADGMCIPE